MPFFDFPEMYGPMVGYFARPLLIVLMCRWSHEIICSHAREIERLHVDLHKCQENLAKEVARVDLQLVKVKRSWEQDRTELNWFRKVSICSDVLHAHWCRGKGFSECLEQNCHCFTLFD